RLQAVRTPLSLPSNFGQCAPTGGRKDWANLTLAKTEAGSVVSTCPGFMSAETGSNTSQECLERKCITAVSMRSVKRNISMFAESCRHDSRVGVAGKLRSLWRDVMLLAERCC